MIFGLGNDKRICAIRIAHCAHFAYSAYVVYADLDNISAYAEIRNNKHLLRIFRKSMAISHADVDPDQDSWPNQHFIK